MENKKLLEAVCVCIGILFLFVGLWDYLDSSRINIYVILSSIVIGAITSYIVAHKNIFKSKLISMAFAAISLGLTLISILLLVVIFNLDSITWLIIIIVGIYLLLFLSEFNHKFFYFILLIYPIYSTYSFLETNIILSLFGTCFILLFCIKLYKDYTQVYKNNTIFSVLVALNTIYIPSKFLYYSLENLIDKPILISFRILTYIIIIDSFVLLYITQFSKLNLSIGLRNTYNVVLSIFSLRFVSRGFWLNIFSHKLVSILIVFIFAVAIISWLLTRILDGSKFCFVLLIIQTINIVSFNLYNAVSTSVFLIILGGVLISLAIFFNKNTIGNKLKKNVFIDNTKLLEQACLCIGILFLFVGLWDYLDFSRLNDYVVLSTLTIGAISSYIVAHKNIFKSTLISIAFAGISLGLAITSIVLLVKIFNLYSIKCLIIVVVGVYLLLFLSEFNHKFFYFVFLIYPIYSLYSFIKTNIILSLLGICFILFFCIKLYKDYIQVYQNNTMFSVLVALTTIYISSRFLYYSIDKLMDKLILNEPIMPYIIIIDSFVLLYIIKFSNLNLSTGLRNTYNVVLSIFSLRFVSCEFWFNIFSTELVSILIVFIFAVAIISWLLTRILDGSKFCFALLIIQTINILLSNLYYEVSTSVFLLILGSVLISLAIFFNKNKIGHKLRNKE